MAKDPKMPELQYLQTHGAPRGSTRATVLVPEPCVLTGPKGWEGSSGHAHSCLTAQSHQRPGGPGRAAQPGMLPGTIILHVRD